MNKTINYDFSNQTIIITGGTRGIGAGMTTAFLAAGANVIATYTSNDTKAMLFKEENIKYQDKLDIQKFDVTKVDEVKSFFTYLDDKYESLEVLINNSGIRQDSVMALMDDQKWQRVMDVNLNGTFYMSREIIPRFMSKKYGRIIQMSSIGGELGLSGQANYAASKAGQMALSKALSKEVAKKKITVNCVCPGFIETELISDLGSELVSEYKKTVPMKRFGQVEDVANVVMFLASREAAYITGTSINVSGGL